MIRIYKYIRGREWIMLLVAVGLIATQVYLDLKLPDFMSQIITLIYTPSSVISEILVEGGYMLACAFGSLVASIITAFLLTRIASNLSARLRLLQFQRVESFSMAEVNKFSTPSLITRTTNDVIQVQMLTMMGGQFIIKAPIMACWAMVKILNKSWQWTAVTGGAIGVLVVLIAFIAFVAIPQFKKIQGLTDSLNRLQRETLTGIRVVRAYNAEEYQEKKFEKTNEEMTRTQLFANRAMQIMNPGMQLIMNGLTLGIYLVGAFLIQSATSMVEGASLFADMMTFTQYAMQVIMAFMMLVIVFIMAPRAIISANRILEVLDTKPSIEDGEGVSVDEMKGKKGEVEFKNVSFKFDGAEGYVIENVSFCAKSGQTVAFIGATGSGKTTLINLLPRFYDASSGEILLNGVNVKKYKLEDLCNRLGYVSQKSVIFSGSIKSNIAFGDRGKEVTDEDIKKAIEIAQATEFVDNQSKGYDAPVSQGGTNFSGGQKQRMSIARGICSVPEVMIFDDTFSALDYKTDKKLRGTLEKEMDGVTKLIVAQRIGTIRDADEIIVLEDGKIVGKGTHTELLNSCSVYKEIALSQLSENEL